MNLALDPDILGNGHGGTTSAPPPQISAVLDLMAFFQAVSKLS